MILKKLVLYEFLRTRFGGLDIPIFYEQAEVEYRNSRKLTAQLAPLIKY